MRITCPHCGFAKEIAAEQIPTNVVRVTCPACRQPFPLKKIEELTPVEAVVRDIMDNGVDPENVYQAIRGGLAGITVLDAKVPLALEGNFKPGFRIELHIKDLANALDTATEICVSVPLASEAMKIRQVLNEDGKGGDDHGGIIQFYEKLAKVKVRRKQ